MLAAHDSAAGSCQIGNLNGDVYGDLLVGAPGEAVGEITAGGMYAFRGTSTAFAPHLGFGQSTGGWTNGNGERFGQSFAFADVDGSTTDLVIAAPGNVVGGVGYAGSLFLWRTAGNNAPTAWRAVGVDSKSPYAE